MARVDTFATIDTIAALETLHGAPGAASLVKLTDRLTPGTRAWIGRSRFVVLSTIGPEGIEVSPRGAAGPVAEIADECTLLLPDRRGNNRLDALRNIGRVGRVALMFFVAGSNNVIRVNGAARLTAEAGVTGRFEHEGRHPRGSDRHHHRRGLFAMRPGVDASGAVERG